MRSWTEKIKLQNGHHWAGKMLSSDQISNLVRSKENAHTIGYTVNCTTLEMSEESRQDSQQIRFHIICFQRKWGINIGEDTEKRNSPTIAEGMK